MRKYLLVLDVLEGRVFPKHVSLGSRVSSSLSGNHFSENKILCNTLSACLENKRAQQAMLYEVEV